MASQGNERSSTAVTQQPGPQAAAVPRGIERRRNPRVKTPRGFLALMGLPGSGSGSPAAVSPRDLSRTGLGFLHSVDVPAHTACTITLRDLAGELVVIPARVVRRRPVRDRVFELGVEFAREIDVERFVRPGVQEWQTANPVRARADIAELAAAMKRLADEEAPLTDLFNKVDELIRLCDSVRAPDQT